MILADTQGWLALAAVMLPSITASVAVVLGTGWLRRVEMQVGRVVAKAEVIEAKVDIVHTATNSRLQNIEEELAVTQRQLREAVELATVAVKARIAAETLRAERDQDTTA